MDTKKLNEENFILLIYGVPRSGKSTLIRYLLTVLDYDVLFILTLTRDFDYLASDSTIITDHLEKDAIQALIESGKEKRKLLIFDDFLQVDLSKLKYEINGLFTTSAHSNISIIVSTQLLRAMPKTIRMCSDKIASFQLDEDIKILFKSVLPSAKFKAIANMESLERHQFIYVDRRNGSKISLNKITTLPAPI